VTRSDRRLAILEQRVGLTRCGGEWLKEALDPFHDTMIDPTGYPDTTCSASVIQPIKQSYQLAAPTGLTTGNWDCNVVMMPWLSNAPTLPTINGLNTINANINEQKNQTVGSSTPTVGGVQFIAAASGTALNIGTVANASSSGTINQSFQIPTSYLSGSSRVVARAIEICNTTSDLNRQGLVTVYRIPVPQNDDGTTMTIKQFHTGDTAAIIGSADVLYMPAPPTTIANAQLFAGTKAWKAADGCYNVGMFNTPDVPAVGANFTQPAMYITSQTDATVYMPQFVANGQDLVNNVEIATVAPVFWTEMEMSGAFFTGLSLTTTLTINEIVYIERFPTQDDLDLIVSAKRSPEYDIRALEAYSIIAQSLPVAVPFDENGLGEWFSAAVDGIQTIAGAIPHPYAQGLAGLIGGGKAVYRAVNDAFDQPASDTQVSSVPRAPAMGPGRSYAPPRRQQVGPRQLRAGKKKLTKAVTKEVRRDVNNAIRGAGAKRGRRKR